MSLKRGKCVLEFWNDADLKRRLFTFVRKFSSLAITKTSLDFWNVTCFTYKFQIKESCGSSLCSIFHLSLFKFLQHLSFLSMYVFPVFYLFFLLFSAMGSLNEVSLDGSSSRVQILEPEINPIGDSPQNSPSPSKETGGNPERVSFWFFWWR